MAKTSPIPVRLSPEIIERIDQVADRMGNTRAGVIKLCITSFLDYFEQNGGIAALPLDWKDVLDSLDGRTRSSRTEVPKAKISPRNRKEVEGSEPEDPALSAHEKMMKHLEEERARIFAKDK